MKLFKFFGYALFLLCLHRPALARDIVEIQPFTRYGKDGLFEAVLEFDIQSGWHIFAPYEQEFGAPLKVEWRLPETAEVIEESFSQPQKFKQEFISFDGYADKAYYKTTIRTSETLKKFPVDIYWQVCADECVPGKISLNIVPQNTLNFDAVVKNLSAEFTDADYKTQPNLLLILLGAFAGGIILNLMPCIFPILSLKIISLAKIEVEKRKQEAWFYALGVIASMTIVAGTLFVLRLSDNSAGWGFQLQSPWFVGAMLFLFIIISLLMLDVITFNSTFLNKLALLKFAEPKLNAFMTGLLAVLIASPCTAPFMGMAIGYALMSPAYIYFPVFLALAVGYALPFGLLAYYPKAVQKILPKPGKWMNILKKTLSIPVILTCVWLAWILAAQLGFITSGKNLKWQEYTPEIVAEALEQKRPVFIDFTADWCVTCLVNKKAALQSDLMAERVKEKNILLLRADMTKPNPKTGKALQSYGRASVPLYIYYDGKSDDYLVLPQILTPGVLAEYLQ